MGELESVCLPTVARLYTVHSPSSFPDQNSSLSQIAPQTFLWSTSSVPWSRTGYHSSTSTIIVCNIPSASQLARRTQYRASLDTAPYFFLFLGLSICAFIYTLAITVPLLYVLGPWPDILFCKTPLSGERCRYHGPGTDCGVSLEGTVLLAYCIIKGGLLKLLIHGLAGLRPHYIFCAP